MTTDTPPVQIISELEKTAIERAEISNLRRAHAARVRELILQGHAAGIGPDEIAEASGLSRDAVYDVLRRPKPDRPG
jgi:DNA invertase Pin-like site-specific DNA recombinase